MVEKGTVDVLLPLATASQRFGEGVLTADNEEGVKARKEVEDTLQKGYWLHNQDGTSLGYRYNGSPTVVREKVGTEPEQVVQRYTPTTWPGVRPPHVFLQDGQTSVFDLLGPEFNIVDFTKEGKVARRFVAVAKAMGIPMDKVHLPNEQHVRRIWERDVVLLRPDGHVCWRWPADGATTVNDGVVREVLQIVSGNGKRSVSSPLAQKVDGGEATERPNLFDRYLRTWKRWGQYVLCLRRSR